MSAPADRDRDPGADRDPERGVAAFSVRRAVTTSMIALALAGFGAFAL